MIKVKIDVTVTVKHEYDDGIRRIVKTEWPAHYGCANCIHLMCEPSARCRGDGNSRHPSRNEASLFECQH